MSATMSFVPCAGVALSRQIAAGRYVVAHGILGCDSNGNAT